MLAAISNMLDRQDPAPSRFGATTGKPHAAQPGNAVRNGNEKLKNKRM
jgi:hypothetical protein